MDLMAFRPETVFLPLAWARGLFNLCIPSKCYKGLVLFDGYIVPGCCDIFLDNLLLHILEPRFGVGCFCLGYPLQVLQAVVV